MNSMQYQPYKISRFPAPPVMPPLSRWPSTTWEGKCTKSDICLSFSLACYPVSPIQDGRIRRLGRTELEMPYAGAWLLVGAAACVATAVLAERGDVVSRHVTGRREAGAAGPASDEGPLGADGAWDGSTRRLEQKEKRPWLLSRREGR